MRRFLTSILVTALLVAGLAVLPIPMPVLAQSVNLQGIQVVPFKAVYIGDTTTAVTTNVAMYIKYVGTAGAATVAVAAADSDISLAVGGSPDTRITAGACGGADTPGTINTANCTTLGSVVDVINRLGAGDWIAVLATGLRADSSQNTLFTLSATDAKTPNGVALLSETPVALAITNALFPLDQAGASLGIRNWLAQTQLGTARLQKNPFADRDSTLLYYSENVTCGGGAIGTITVYCVRENYVWKGNSTETVNTLFQKAGATCGSVGTLNEFTSAGGLSCSGGKLLVRTTATVALTAPLTVLTGFVRPTSP